MKVFGLNLIGRKIPELLMKDVKHKFSPEKWNWKPHNPRKIKNIKSIISKERKETYYTVITNYEYDIKNKQKVVLSFSMGNLAYGLLNHFEDKNIKYFYINYVQFIAQSGKIIISSQGDVEKKFIEIQNIKLDLDDVQVVLWTPPNFPNPIIDFDMIPSRKGRNDYLFRKRWQQFLISLEILLENAVWIPGKPKNGSQEWQNKLGEYFLCKQFGLNIPPVIFTNDENEVLEFFSQDDKILLREFSCSPFSYPPIHLNLNKIDFKFLNISPCTFQKYIEKEYELRVVVFFDSVYPCKIHSQDSELTKEDWRVHDDANVRWEQVTIPYELKKSLIMFVKKLNLVWASVDLIKSVSGEYYFLEANRPGAHYWLDMFVGLDITDIISSKIKALLNE